VVQVIFGGGVLNVPVSVGVALLMMER